ncbi:MAG TPA: nickel pincer cofactor biosynthesis protein LarC [Candidatus Binataceae bacterium]|jgi:uncharacterized protein (TIGR00299 family) protein|nr:nickel pincer cofactor biosynthesis protein LarC [Candidatus Binataceae bacterium]
MKTAFLDAFSGLSGDMIVGALLDAGADFDALRQAVDSLGIDGYRLSRRPLERSGIVATKFEVEVSTPQPERHLSEILTMITRAALKPEVAARATAVFRALAEAEARVHRTTPEEVHFHEVGAVDSIIDVVGAALALDQLGLERLLVSELPMGGGFARSRHGVIPVPPPATLELLHGYPIRLGDGEAEMVTPTGAAIVKALAEPAPAVLNFTSELVAYGAGTRDLRDRPNLLRVLIGHTSQRYLSDDLLEISANIDDLNPQIYEHLSDRLFAAGARDVALTPTIMKKGRPAVMVSVLAEAALRERIAEVIFAETSTIGLRFHAVSRLKLARRTLEVATRHGAVRVKVSGEDSGIPTVAPEYEDCRTLARQRGVPLKLIIEEALAAARAKLAQ